jgi:hypothetical protein
VANSFPHEVVALFLLDKVFGFNMHLSDKIRLFQPHLGQCLVFSGSCLQGVMVFLI